MKPTYLNPFTVLIDTAESHPFSFNGMKGDARHKYRLIEVPTRRVCLGRFPHSLGDYSIEGMAERVGIERKSLDDIQGTVLGWTSSNQGREASGRRQRFEQELENLSKLEAALVVVECNYQDAIKLMPEYGVKTAQENAKIFNRSIQAFLMDYRVPWHWAGSRRMAELFTFQFLRRFWEYHKND